MFLHLGGDTLVRTKKIIAIINMQNSSTSGLNKKYVKVSQEEGYKSKIFTDEAVYLSPISSLTLKKRVNFINKLG
jgi:extracellular matrix regulatory protein B